MTNLETYKLAKLRGRMLAALDAAEISLAAALNFRSSADVRAQLATLRRYIREMGNADDAG